MCTNSKPWIEICPEQREMMLRDGSGDGANPFFEVPMTGKRILLPAAMATGSSICRRLHVEAEEDDVAVLHYIVLALGAH